MVRGRSLAVRCIVARMRHSVPRSAIAMPAGPSSARQARGGTVRYGPPPASRKS